MENQIKFTETVIVQKLLSKNKEFQEWKLLNANARTTNQIDGFMGNIIFLTLDFETQEKMKKTLKLVVKLMKPPSKAREQVNAEMQFTNEIFIYHDVIPTYYKKFQEKFKTIDKDLWCPKVYLAEVGKYPELSDLVETILVMDDLTPKGYRLGNRSNLDREELLLMTKSIAQYHACTYALRILKDPVLEELKNGIKPLRFIREDGTSSYSSPYKVSMKRLFKCVEDSSEVTQSDKFRKDIQELKSRYGNQPLDLMERFLRDHETYSVILHGDYNRNNVLFKYENRQGQDIPIDLRLIDFQELRYGSPAIDLSFFMYMNMHPKLLKEDFFEELLSKYHSHLINALCELLECKRDDIRLKEYDYENFSNHFKQFAFYGAMVSIMFIPWMVSSEKECEDLAAAYDKDMNGDEFKNLAMACGGDEVNQRILEVAKHASKSGFIDMIKIID